MLISCISIFIVCVYMYTYKHSHTYIYVFQELLQLYPIVSDRYYLGIIFQLSRNLSLYFLFHSIIAYQRIIRGYIIIFFCHSNPHISLNYTGKYIQHLPPILSLLLTQPQLGQLKFVFQQFPQEGFLIVPSHTGAWAKRKNQ